MIKITKNNGLQVGTNSSVFEILFVCQRLKYIQRLGFLFHGSDGTVSSATTKIAYPARLNCVQSILPQPVALYCLFVLKNEQPIKYSDRNEKGMQRG